MSGRFLVIYDYMQFPKDAPSRKLVAYSQDGTELWTAESISTMSTDAYVNFLSETPLIVGNFLEYDVTIDPETGAVLDTKFTK